ncbi:hypothetical protein TRV_00428 [Trichophyton verrucosum HKI 0517]|uniref:MIND kinetochore complex component Mtw1 n=1 Tax=Trichophyton verrucosum (strain HKI 0517) TaxID=663202 RepID=D4D034_TRIVH|nr:uncharacterized protein TRV_00428 [Trichophyton verrucosum HKI 0517]EFE44756.1 hypothetical protein TRV_00428 [Trichophyton verrucosum HKI 0517]
MNDASTALLTEHFSYTPLSLIDDVINSVNNLIYQAISSLEDGLQSTPPEKLGFRHGPGTIPDTDDDGNIQYPEARLEIENGLHQLETLLEATVDKAFDKFEIYVLRNVLTVPEDLTGWIRLSHHEGLSLEPAREGAPTEESLTLQRQRLRETKKLNRMLTHECARNDAVLSQLRSMVATVKQNHDGATVSVGANGSADMQLPNLSFLLSDPRAKKLRMGDGGAGPSHTPLTTNTTFILSQLPALRAVLTQLRTKLQTLPKSVGEMDLDQKKGERREYINSRAKLHLERTSGTGESEHGHGVIRGKRINPEEVQALEGVATTFSK